MSNARELAQLPSVPSGRRSLITNGSFAIAQRGTTFTSASAPVYTLDRWYWNSQAEDVVTIEQSSDHPKGSGSSIKVTVTTADVSITGDYADIEQRLEGLDLQHLLYGTADAKSVTLSFWVKSSEIGDMAVGLFAEESRNIGTTVTINSANTWEYKTVTFVGDTIGAITNDNSTGMRVWMHLLAGSNFTSVDNTTWGAYTTTRKAYGQTLNVLGTVSATFQLADVQLEVGSVATEFEHRSFDEELQLCERYFQKTLGYSTVAGTATTTGVVGSTLRQSDQQTGYIEGDLKFTKRMRAAPTITVYDKNGTAGKVNYYIGGTTTANYTATIIDIIDTGFSFYSDNVTTKGGVRFAYTADAEL